MKRSHSKRNLWEDHYARQAKKEHFPARSVYKLKEMQQKFRLIRKGDSILDLGCAPGAWLLYAADIAGTSGRVVGIDLKPVQAKLPANVRVFIGDILSIKDDLLQAMGIGYNVVMSDMAAATTGNRGVDAVRSFNLSIAALALARTRLKPGGTFVCKIFQGEDFKDFTDSVKSCFAEYRVFKPQSSRKASKEIFIIGRGSQSPPV